MASTSTLPTADFQWAEKFDTGDVGFGIQKLVVGGIIKDGRVETEAVQDAVSRANMRFYARTLQKFGHNYSCSSSLQNTLQIAALHVDGKKLAVSSLPLSTLSTTAAAELFVHPNPC